MREIKVNELKEGMTTAVDVFSPKGQLILKRHQAVSAFDIAKFGFYNIASVYVEGRLNCNPRFHTRYLG